MRSRGHRYEELPVNSEEALDELGMSQPAQTPSMNGPPSLNLSPSQGGFHSRENLLFNNSVATDLTHSYPRKRNNPLYDNKENDEVMQKNDTHRDGCMCVSIALLFVVVLSVAAICLSVYVLMNRNDSNDDPKSAYVISPSGDNKTLLEAALYRIEQLEQQVQTLNAELDSYQHLSSANVDEKFSYLSRWLTNVSSDTQKLAANVSTVSKLPGPQGPPGVGNLSQCEYKHYSSGGSAQAPQNYSPTVPSEQDAQDWVILGVECSTNTGTSAFLETVNNDLPFVQFRCRCFGRSDGSSGNRYCIMYVWRCPTIS